MGNKDGRTIEREVIDAVTERPLSVEFGGRKIRFYPITFGKLCIQSRYLESWGKGVIEAMRKRPAEMAMEICRVYRKDVCRLLAVHTAKGREEVWDEEIMEDREALFRGMECKDLAKLFIYVVNSDRYDRFVKYFGIDREKRDLEKAVKAKKSEEKNSVTVSFGGKSIYGTLIDRACERYGWTLEYVIWGISYENLQMLMADAVVDIHLTKEEARRARISTDREYINADDPRNKERIKQLFKGK